MFLDHVLRVFSDFSLPPPILTVFPPCSAELQYNKASLVCLTIQTSDWVKCPCETLQSITVRGQLHKGCCITNLHCDINLFTDTSACSYFVLIIELSNKLTSCTQLEMWVLTCSEMWPFWRLIQLYNKILLGLIHLYSTLLPSKQRQETLFAIWWLCWWSWITLIEAVKKNPKLETLQF